MRASVEKNLGNSGVMSEYDDTNFFLVARRAREDTSWY
jgi:hypothetical protein